MHPGDFEDLQRLIAWKRHELPPPRYFSDFSGSVVERLELEESGVERGWWHRLLASYDSRPVLACAYGVAIGGLVVLGMSFAQIFQQEKVAALPPTSPWMTVSLPPATLVNGQMSKSTFPASYGAAISSIAPVISPAPPAFLFGGSGLRVQTVSFGLGRE